MTSEQEQRKLDRQVEIACKLRGTTKVKRSLAKKIYHLGNQINRREAFGNGYSAEGLLDFSNHLPEDCRFADVDEIAGELPKALGPYRAATIGFCDIHISDEVNYRRRPPYHYYYVFTLNMRNHRIFCEEAEQEGVLYF